jgi:hypothetical protein
LTTSPSDIQSSPSSFKWTASTPRSGRKATLRGDTPISARNLTPSRAPRCILTYLPARLHS